MPSEEQDILKKAREMIKEDIAETFSGIKPPGDEKEPEDEKKDEADEEADSKESKDEEGDGKKTEKKDEKPEDKKVEDKDKDEDKEKKPDEKADGDKGDEKKADEGKKDEKDEKKDDKDSALTQLEAQNKVLMEQVEALSGQIFAGPQAEKVEDKADTKPKDEKDKKPDEKADEKKPEPVQLVDQKTFEEATSSAEGLNALLVKVVDTAAKEGERRGYERAIRETPALVDKLTEKAVGVREAVHDFLAENKDLVPLRQFVGLEVNLLRAKNPDWPLDKLFEEAGEAVREKLKLSKVAEEINDEKGAEDKPAFSKRGAGGGGKGRESTDSKLTDLQKEIAELADVA